MKRLLLLFAVAPLLFASCGNDSGEDYAEKIIGKWYESAYKGTTASGTSVSDTYTEANSPLTMTFTSDKTVTVTDSSSTGSTGTWAYKGKVLTLSFSGTSTQYRLNFSGDDKFTLGYKYVGISVSASGTYTFSRCN
jgi:hypothetical protein